MRSDEFGKDKNYDGFEKEKAQEGMGNPWSEVLEGALGPRKLDPTPRVISIYAAMQKGMVRNKQNFQSVNQNAHGKKQ